MRWSWIPLLALPACIEIDPAYVDETSTGSTVKQDLGVGSDTLEMTDDGDSEDGSGDGSGDGPTTGETSTDTDTGDGSTSTDTTGDTTADTTTDTTTDTGGMGEHEVFVTSAAWPGDLGGLAGGDAKCQQAAQDAGLMGTWKAILSTSNGAAKDRLNIAGPIRDLGGALIANDAADLWDGSISVAIDLDENMQMVTGKTWTGTTVNGSTDPDHCLDFTDAGNGPKGQKGDTTSAAQDWVQEGFLICGANAHLYCLSQ